MLEFCPYKEMGVAKNGLAKIFTIAALSGILRGSGILRDGYPYAGH